MIIVIIILRATDASVLQRILVSQKYIIKCLISSITLPATCTKANVLIEFNIDM